MKKLLIVYYSWSCGNTERTAKALQSVAGGDLVRLDTAVPYTGSYNETLWTRTQKADRETGC